MNTTNSLGLSVTSVSIPAATTRAAPLVSSGKAPPNLPQGVPPLLHNQYIVGPGGLLPAYPIYGYDDLQMLQSRLPMDYYGITFSAPATLTGRDGSLANNPYSGDVTKFGRGDSASPAPATTLAQPQQNQTQTHHTTQQPFLNPTLPPGYSYTGLPYYAGVPGVPSAFQYGPTMFVPPASAKQHGVNLNTASTPFQQASGYGQHGYGAAGYDDLTQGTAAGDYSKGGYSGSSQAQKSAGTGPGKGVSVTSSNTGVPDISGSVYNKTQTFDKQGFHAGTPPPFSLPSALGSTGSLIPRCCITIFSKMGWIRPTQPTQHHAAKVSGYQNHLWHFSILDKLNLKPGRGERMKGEEEKKQKKREKKPKPIPEIIRRSNCSAKHLCRENCSQPAILCVTRSLPL
uniref:UBAP2 n=1 Tax=Buteo japonicus TaxID=224669 RepID=A0A8C0HSB6_9AVES